MSEYPIQFNLSISLKKVYFICSAFEKFKYAHELTDTPEAVALATEWVIRDFNDDNVVYVELRSTPRSTPKMNKDEYIMAVIETIL